MEDNPITDDRARRFAAGLRTFEQDSDVAPFAALFADDAVVERLDARGERRGEGTSTGTLRDDRAIDHRGVPVVDLDGDTIIRLRTYCDSAAFVLVPAETT